MNVDKEYIRDSEWSYQNLDNFESGHQNETLKVSKCDSRYEKYWSVVV